MLKTQNFVIIGDAKSNYYLIAIKLAIYII